jgi:hypothetical protein
MKTISIIILLVIGSSCSIFKVRSKNNINSEIHHYHDSIHTIERLTTKEVSTVGDSSTANFVLQKLLESGYGKQVNGNFTTELRISDGVLSVTSTLDSITQRISEMEKTMSQTQKNDVAIIEYRDKAKIVKVVNYTPLILLSILLFVLIIGGVILWKKWRALKLKSSIL